MKLLFGLLGAALGLGALALVLDSPVLILSSVALIGVASVGLLAVGLRTARRGDFVVPHLGILAVALGAAAIAVAAVVVGERGDAPGLVLWGIAVIVGVIVGVSALGARLAQRGSR